MQLSESLQQLGVLVGILSSFTSSMTFSKMSYAILQTSAGQPISLVRAVSNYMSGPGN